MRGLGTILAWDELDGEIFVEHVLDMDGQQGVWLETTDQTTLETEGAFFSRE
jgi:hypothetical protein